LRFLPDGPAHLERPYHTMHGEVLRWHDHWLKGIDTGVMNEPPVRYWVMGANQWRTASDWPVPETQWTKLYLSSWERLTPDTRVGDAGPVRRIDQRPEQGQRRRRGQPKRVQDHDHAGDAAIGLRFLRQEIAGERKIGFTRIALAKVDLAVMGAESGQIVGQRQGFGLRASGTQP